jgi:hypothetical protein
MSSGSKHNFEVYRTGIVCKKHVDCINNFLQYNKTVLEHTISIWKNRDGQPKNIPESKKDEYATDLYQLGYVNSKKKALEFIKHWNESPTICCMVDGMDRKGRCVNHLSQCYDDHGVVRSRTITLDELLEIKLKAGIIPSDSECISDKHCKEKHRTSWRDPFTYKCKKPEYKCKKERKAGEKGPSCTEDGVDINSCNSLEDLEFFLDNQ